MSQVQITRDWYPIDKATPVETDPLANKLVQLGWRIGHGEWQQEVGYALTTRGGLKRHPNATHWQERPEPPDYSPA